MEQPSIRFVDNQTILPVLRELVESGQSVRLTVSGSSMSPLLCHQRDSVLLEPIRRPLRRGDIALYQRTNGQYVLHRVCRVDPQGRLYCIGDAQTQVEGPLEPGQCFALAAAVCRKGQWLRPGDFWWEFFARAWLRMVPLRRPVMRLYARIARKK